MRRRQPVNRNRRASAARNRNKLKVNYGLLIRLFALSVFIGLAGAYVINTPDLDIETVNIRGTVLADSVKIDDIKDSLLDRNILTLNKIGLAKELVQMDEIKEVRISRHLPGTLNIDVVERKPIASLKIKDGYAYIADDYLPFHKSEVPAKSVPVMYAAGCNDVELRKPNCNANYEYVVNTLKSVRQEGLNCKKISVDRKANLCLNMDSGLLVKLGQPDDIPTKISQLRLTLEYKPSLEREALYVDVSCPSEKVYMPKSNGHSVL